MDYYPHNYISFQANGEETEDIITAQISLTWG